MIEKHLKEQQNSRLIRINEDNLDQISKCKFISVVYKYLGIQQQN